LIKKKIQGISQRDCRSFYQVLIENRKELLERIKNFYLLNIHKKFYDQSYVFDVCLGKVTYINNNNKNINNM
jgi:hypothetical protein